MADRRRAPIQGSLAPSPAQQRAAARDTAEEEERKRREREELRRLLEERKRQVEAAGGDPGPPLPSTSRRQHLTPRQDRLRERFRNRASAPKRQRSV